MTFCASAIDLLVIDTALRAVLGHGYSQPNQNENRQCPSKSFSFTVIILLVYVEATSL